MGFLHKFNSDDVFLRAVTIALLDLLNNNLVIWNRISDNEIVEIPIPFFYNSSGDERFMLDLFMGDTLDDCISVKEVEGNVDRIPRGTVKLDSCTINVATFTNRFIKGEYMLENEKGEMETYIANIMVVPLDLIYSVSIKLDTLLDLFKTTERLIEIFYKTVAFKALYNGMTIQISASFPEDEEMEKTYEFSYGDVTDLALNFSIAIETYLPVMDHTNRFLKTNTIQAITVKSGPITKPFPFYEVPKESRYVTKAAFTTDDSPDIKLEYLEPIRNEKFPDPIAELEDLLQQERNADGSIGIPGTENYIDSFGRSYNELNNIQPEDFIPMKDRIK